MAIQIEFKDAGEQAIICYLPLPVLESYPDLLLQMITDVKEQYDQAISDIVPSFRSLLIEFSSTNVDDMAIKKFISTKVTQYSAQQASSKTKKTSPRIIEIPVCYDPSFALDIHNITEHHHISIDKVIELHCSKSYQVYSLGFIPGFAFLGYVDDQIAMPRQATPRACVPQGSVGIAGKQTGVYPIDSPGGWQIIGRTPLELYNPNKNLFSLFSISDRVQFYPISLSTFKKELAYEL